MPFHLRECAKGIFGGQTGTCRPNTISCRKNACLLRTLAGVLGDEKRSFAWLEKGFLARSGPSGTRPPSVRMANVYRPLARDHAASARRTMCIDFAGTTPPSARRAMCIDDCSAHSVLIIFNIRCTRKLTGGR
jgi:hypothetical protein